MKICTNCGVEFPKSNFYKGAGKCIPCKKEYDRGYRSSRRKEGLEYQRARRASPDGYVDRFIERINIKTPDTDIDRNFFEGKMSTCAFTGMPFSYSNKHDCYHNPTAPSIDRINSQEGYHTWNTQVILSCINRMKNDTPQEDFEKLWAALMSNT